jgi:hypothetical protein
MSFKRIVSALVLFAASSGASLLAQGEGEPPVVTYSSPRTSAEWIEVGGTKVAVDKGAEWRGVKVYLSLMWDLIAVDVATQKVLWNADVGAFWNEFTFREIESPRTRNKAWAVELRPGPHAKVGKDERAYYELANGAIIPQKDKAPRGDELKPLTQWHGDQATDGKKLSTIITTAKDWKDVVLNRFFTDPASAPEFKDIDFEKWNAVVCMSGDGHNCAGITATAYESDDQILVRLHHKYYQTAGFDGDGGAEKVRAWGIFLLPKRDPFKTIVIERNAQNLIGGPALWTEIERFKVAPQPADRSGAKEKRK